MGELIQPQPQMVQLVKRFLELPQFSFTNWDTVGQVKDAIRQLEQGRFDLATQLVDAMTRDDRVEGALELRCQGIDALPLVFKQGIGGRAGEAAEALQASWTTMYPKAEVQKLRRWGHMLGLGVAENRWVFNPDTKRIEPRLYTWHPRWIWWNWATRTYWMAAMEGVIELTPMTGQWILYAPHGHYLAWMHGLVRSIYVPWLLRQWNLRDSGRYGEAYGSVTKKARFPANIDDEDKDDFLRDVAALGSESVIALPQSSSSTDKKDYDVEFLEVEGTGGDFFDKMIQLASTNISIRIVGNNLTTEVKEGSRAAAVVHDNIRSDIIQDDTDSLSSCLKAQSVEFWAQYNFGDRQAAPTPLWNCAPPADKKEEGEGLVQLAEGVRELVLTGIPVDAQKLMEKFGVPLREDASDDDKRIPLPLDKDLIALGVPSVNEARERLGQQAMDGGDEIPKVNPDPPPDDGSGGPPQKKKPKAKLKDEEKDPASTPTDAQLALDALSDVALKATQEARIGELGALWAAVEHATSLDDLKTKLTLCYAKMDDKSFETVLKKAMLVADYMGRDFGQTER